MKRIMCLLMVSVMALVCTFTGCTGQYTPPDFEMQEGGYDGSEVEITFYHTMGADLAKVLGNYIEQFNVMYPNIKITHSQEGGYDDVKEKIATEVTVGAQPNIAYCYPDHVALYNRSAAVCPLDVFIESDIPVARADGTTEKMGLTDAQIDDFITGYYEEGRQFGDGKMYTLPFSKSTEVLYYNKTFFVNSKAQYENEYVKFDTENKLNYVPATKEEYDTALSEKIAELTAKNAEQNLGKTAEQIESEAVAAISVYKSLGYQDEDYNIFVPTTWDEMEIMCKRIINIKTKEANGEKVDIIPLGYDSEANWFITMCEQYGSPYTSATGNHYLFDNATNRKFVETFAGWYKKGYFTTQNILGSYTSNLFKEQKSYMGIGSSAGASKQSPNRVEGEFPFEVGITPIPQINPENPKVISQGPSICIFKDENPQEVIASWLFVKFLATSVDFQVRFADASGYLPPLKSVADHPTYSKKLANPNGFENVTYLAAKVCLEQADAYYTSPAFSGSSTARDQVGALMKAVFEGTKSIDEAFTDAIDECRYFY